MNLFVWTIAVLIAVNAIIKTVWLSTQDIPQRTTTDIGWDLVVEIALLIWAAILLSK